MSIQGSVYIHMRRLFTTGSFHASLFELIFRWNQNMVFANSRSIRTTRTCTWIRPDRHQDNGYPRNSISTLLTWTKGLALSRNSCLFRGLHGLERSLNDHLFSCNCICTFSGHGRLEPLHWHADSHIERPKGLRWNCSCLATSQLPR